MDKNQTNPLEHILKSVHICLLEIDLEHKTVTCGTNIEDVLGYSYYRVLEYMDRFSQKSETVYIQVLTDFVCPEDRQDMVSVIRAAKKGQPGSFQGRIRGKNRKYKWYSINLIPIVSQSKLNRIIFIITDIDSMKSEIIQLKQRVQQDCFTGILSKKYAEEQIKWVLNHQGDKCHVLILFDLDNFKKVNDQYGHRAGDQVILSVAKRLTKVFRKEDIIGRFGGDEFIIFLKNTDVNMDIHQSLERLVSESTYICGVTKSAGVAVYPRDGNDYESLFDRADRALYEAKRKRTGVVFACQQEGEDKKS